jgi:O-antigen/teichoic acid export membrane protein
MRKTFLLNLFLQVALNLIVKPLYIFGIDRGVQNTVGASAYGFYFSLWNLSLVLQMVNDFGIQNFTSKTIAEQPENASKYFSNLLIFKILLSSVYFVLTFVVAYSLGYETQQLQLLFLLTLVQVFSSFFLFFRANLAGLGFFKTDSLLSVFDRLGLLLLGGFLLFYHIIDKENGIWYLALAQIFSMFSASMIAFFVLKSKIAQQPLRVDFSFLKKIIKESFPFALIALLMTFYTRSDAIMLERLLTDGKEQAGIYASAYRLLDALNAVTLIFGTLLLPMFSRQIAAKESLKSLLSLSLTLVSFIGITAGFSVYAYRLEIIQLLYHDATSVWADILGILLLSYIPLSLMYVLGSLSTAKNLLRPQHWLFGIAVIFNFLLNFFLIRFFKAEGAAYSTLLTQCFVVIGLVAINQFVFDWKKISNVLIYSILYASFLYFLQKTNYDWRVEIIVAFIFSALLSALLGFWELRKIAAMLQEKREK